MNSHLLRVDSSSPHHITISSLIRKMSPLPWHYKTLLNSGIPSFKDLRSTLERPDPTHTASHRLRCSSNAALQMSNSEYPPPEPLNPHFDVHRNRNEFFDMIQSPTSSKTMLLTPEGFPSTEHTWSPHRSSQRMPFVELDICDSRHGTNSDVLQVGSHLH
jgi:hypothetical protein